MGGNKSSKDRDTEGVWLYSVTFSNNLSLAPEYLRTIKPHRYLGGSRIEGYVSIYGNRDDRW